MKAYARWVDGWMGGWWLRIASDHVVSHTYTYHPEHMPATPWPPDNPDLPPMDFPHQPIVPTHLEQRHGGADVVGRKQRAALPVQLLRLGPGADQAIQIPVVPPHTTTEGVGGVPWGQDGYLCPWQPTGTQRS